MVEKAVDRGKNRERNVQKTVRATLTLNAEADMGVGQPLKAQINIDLIPNLFEQTIRIERKRGDELRAIINGDDDTLTKISKMTQVIMEETDDDEQECPVWSLEENCLIQNLLLWDLAFGISFGDGGSLLDVFGSILIF